MAWDVVLLGLEEWDWARAGCLEWENMVVCLVRMLRWYEFAGGFALGVGQF